MHMRRLVIVTGLSGAGKSQAMKSFEDFGFACLDNVPPVLAPAFVELVRASDRDTAALAFDVRSGGAFGEASTTLEQLLNDGLRPEVLFLDADDETLVRRYSETRRRHPLYGTASTLIEAIAAERASLAGLRDRADFLWDTTNFTQATLKEHIDSTFVANGTRHTRTTVIAFGFKYGVPLDADWTFDVRFLPNPHYQLELRPLNGNDAEVAAFLETSSDLEPFLDRLFSLVDFVVPRARAEGKSQLTFAIGCTGGRHRSVYVARRLAKHLIEIGEDAPAIEERDLRR
jgi:RNase adapter protein RapZ